MSPPFPPSCALDGDRLIPSQDTNDQKNSSQTINKKGHITYIPGNPAVQLFSSEVYKHISTELEVPLLDELYDKLWLVARKSGLSIDPLHVQVIKGRKIIPAEDPELHLVWNRDKIYVKPVPVFLLNHDFWTLYLQPPRLPKAPLKSSQMSFEMQPPAHYRSLAVGFLRSYALLVTSKLDFTIAKESHLIPSDIDWLKWSKFMCFFRNIERQSVAKRYHYGQLRLSRLNWAVRIFRPRSATTSWFYKIPYWSTSEFVARVSLPLVFIFASVSLALSSMQVALSVPLDSLGSQKPNENGLRDMSQAFWGFSVAVLVSWLLIWILLLGIPIAVFAWQFLWGYRNREKPQPACDTP